MKKGRDGKDRWWKSNTALAQPEEIQKSSPWRHLAVYWLPKGRPLLPSVEGQLSHMGSETGHPGWWLPSEPGDTSSPGNRRCQARIWQRGPCLSKISKGLWRRHMLHHYWHPSGIPALHLLLQFSPLHCTAARPGFGPKTKLSSSWTGRKLPCVLMTHLVVVSSQYQEICFMHEKYLIQKS